VSTLTQAAREAAQLVVALDPDLARIVLLSLRVSLTAVAIAAFVGLPLGALIAVARFPGRRALIILLNALMGLPPVVVGLLVYLMLSRAGPLGALGILFTPAAMVIAQAILITPIIAALSRQVTRVMTTAIALETSKGDLPLALGLGMVLVTIVLLLNAAAYLIKDTAQRRHG
jgi:tungstate transport system permease protein